MKGRRGDDCLGKVVQELGVGVKQREAGPGGEGGIFRGWREDGMLIFSANVGAHEWCTRGLHMWTTLRHSRGSTQCTSTEPCGCDLTRACLCCRWPRRPLPSVAIAQFVHACMARWPNAVLQFEDFSINNAHRLLTRYRQHHLVFNDDIQVQCLALAGPGLALGWRRGGGVCVGAPY